MLNNLGYENNFTCTGGCYYSGSLENVPNWVYNRNYWYWTMSPNNDSASYVWGVHRDGDLSYYNVRSNFGVRPVITISKVALGDIDENITDSNSESDEFKETEEEIKDNNDKKGTKTTENDSNNKPNESNIIVKVANTYMSSSITIIIVGFITASVSILIIYKLSNKKR